MKTVWTYPCLARASAESLTDAEARDMFAHEHYSPLDSAAAIREYVAARRLGFDRPTARMMAEAMIESEDAR
jgi:hypothetical protein